MPNNIKIRLAEESDCQEMLDIYAPFVKETTVSFEYEIPSYDEFKNRIIDVQKKYPWIVCVVDDAIAGYAYASPFNKRSAYEWSVDYSIYVSPTKHKLGIGTALYTCLTDILRFQGFYNAYAGVTSSNNKSENFHKSFGFKEVGTYHNAGYKFNNWHHVTWYEYQIADVENPPKKIKFIHEINFAEEIIFMFEEAKKLISL